MAAKRELKAVENTKTDCPSPKRTKLSAFAQEDEECEIRPSEDECSDIISLDDYYISDDAKEYLQSTVYAASTQIAPSSEQIIAEYFRNRSDIELTPNKDVLSLLADVMDYFVEEFVYLTGNHAINCNEIVLRPQHIKMAMHREYSLNLQIFMDKFKDFNQIQKSKIFRVANLFVIDSKISKINFESFYQRLGSFFPVDHKNLFKEFFNAIDVEQTQFITIEQFWKFMRFWIFQDENSDVIEIGARDMLYAQIVARFDMDCIGKNICIFV